MYELLYPMRTFLNLQSYQLTVPFKQHFVLPESKTRRENIKYAQQIQFVLGINSKHETSTKLIDIFSTKQKYFPLNRQLNTEEINSVKDEPRKA